MTICEAECTFNLVDISGRCLLLDRNNRVVPFDANIEDAEETGLKRY